MDIHRPGSRPTTPQPPEAVTGQARQDGAFKAEAPGRLVGATVTFEPGARTAWHTHPFGQHLVITMGLGWVQVWGQPKQEVRVGDVVWFPAGEKHWHGATDRNAMAHLALAEALDGKATEWREHVTDEEYLG